MTKIQLTHAVGNPEIDYTKKIMELLAGETPEEKYKTLVEIMEMIAEQGKTEASQTGEDGTINACY